MAGKGTSEHILVLGAGFQGVCVALALHHRGYSVTLVDKAPDCILRASLRNEGKIHMGFVYANDTTFKTSSLMLDASLSFSRCLERWLETSINWNTLKSLPFTYAILRSSLLSPETILGSYETLQNRYAEIRNGMNADYLGDVSAAIWRELPPSSLNRSINNSSKLIETVEVALDLVKFRHLLRSKLIQSNGINRLYNHTVETVTRTSEGFVVEGMTPDGSVWRLKADRVVNCLWDGRLKLDQQMGLLPDRKWVYRLKYRLLGNLPSTIGSLPSLTFVLGPFGDVVVYPSGRVYISWYPACMRGWSADLLPPKDWERACDGQVDREVANEIVGKVFEEFGEFVPGLRETRVDTVDAGIIFSWGERDISDLRSELHERFDIGIQSSDGYYSINTGKFTCAPLFAEQLLTMLQ